MATEVGVPCVCVFVFFLRIWLSRFPMSRATPGRMGENQTTAELLLGICCENVALRIEGASCILITFTDRQPVIQPRSYSSYKWRKIMADCLVARHIFGSSNTYSR